MWNKGLWVCLVSAAVSAAAAAAPPPEKVLDAALSPPTVTYRLRTLTTIWRGGKGRTEEAVVYFRPPAQTRREFLGPDGKVTRVVVSDGQTERVSVPGRARGMHGAAVKATAKTLSPERERALLLENYRLEAAPEEKLAGRSAWVVTLTPKVRGKPNQVYAVDAETGILLRVRRYLPGTDMAVQTVVEDLSTGVPLTDELFRSSGPSEGHGLEPDFLGAKEAAKASGMDYRPPESLPGGFVLESADAFDVDGTQVLAARYTDGLAVLSLYRTGRPAAFDDPDAHGGSLRSCHWAGGGSHFTLVGDLTDESLQELSLPLRSHR